MKIMRVLVLVYSVLVVLAPGVALAQDYEVGEYIWVSFKAPETVLIGQEYSALLEYYQPEKSYLVCDIYSVNKNTEVWKYTYLRNDGSGIYEHPISWIAEETGNYRLTCWLYPEWKESSTLRSGIFKDFNVVKSSGEYSWVPIDGPDEVWVTETFELKIEFFQPESSYLTCEIDNDGKTVFSTKELIQHSGGYVRTIIFEPKSLGSHTLVCVLYPEWDQPSTSASGISHSFGVKGTYIYIPIIY